MNRIFRLVWNRELNAMVVASELASSQSAGSGPSIDERHALPAFGALAVALAFALSAGNAHASEQSLRDLQALTAKYTQQAPVKVDAEAAIAVLANQPTSRALLDVNTNVALQLGSQVPVVRNVLPAKVDANVGLKVQAPTAAAPLGVSASVAANVAAPAVAPVKGLLGGDVNLKVDTDAAVDLGVRQASLQPSVKTEVAATVAAGALGTDAKLQAQAAATVAVRDEELADTHDTQIIAALDAGVAGKVAVQGNAAEVIVADRNIKVAAEAPVAAQASSLGLGGLLNGVGTGVGSLLDGVGGAVGNLANGNLNGTVGSLVGGVGGLVGNTVGGLGLSTPSAIPPTSPKAPRPADPNSGLIVGTGGAVGTLSGLLSGTTQSLFGTTESDRFISNGNTRISNANIQQVYSDVGVLGIPLINLAPVGTLLNGLGNTVTGGSSHLTVLGGATSDSYITNINNGATGGLLGLLLPGQAPAWASECLNVLGLVTIDCWAVNPAQDYQVLVGDGAYANGSREVVIGANASHRLPTVDASVAFPGAGVNDPTDPTGVPTADYAARLGHSVVVGDSASGTANGQVLLGAEATSNQANSVALGFRSSATRGAQASYTPFGLTTAQQSAGEVSVGAAGAERQITHVAAGSAATDAVNVRQLQGAIDQVNAISAMAVVYDLDAAGDPNFRSVTLGNGSGTTMLNNVAAGSLAASSTQAVNGAQLGSTNLALAGFLGGTAAFDPATAAFTAPTFAIASVAADGTVNAGTYANVTDAFDAVDGSLNNLNTRISNINNAGTRFVKVNSTLADAAAAGVESVAIGGGASATADNAVAIGSGSIADRADTVSVGIAGGERQLVNVAAGTATTDAVNLGQLVAAGQAQATHLGGGAAVGVDGVVSAPTYSIGSVGVDGVVTTGDYNDVGSAFDAVDGSLSNLNTQISNINNGAASRFLRVNSTGVDAAATGVDAVALGAAASATAAGSVALGSNSVADRENSVSVGAVGAERQITNVAAATGATDAVNLAQLRASEDGALRYNVAADDSIDYSRATLGTTGTATVLDNVGAGSITAGSSEAVNGGQIFDANQSIATHLGGGATVTTTGAVSAPTYTINNVAVDGSVTAGSYNNVGSAFDAVSTSLLNVADQAETVDRLAVKYDADAAGNATNSITLTGDGTGAAVRLSNLADGAIVAGSTEAVTGNQLAATHQSIVNYFGGSTAVDSVTGIWTGPSFRVSTIALDGSFTGSNYSDVTSAFTAVDGSLLTLNQRIETLQTGNRFFAVNSAKGAASATGTDAVAVGPASTATGTASVAVGDGAAASADNSVALGAGATTSVGAQQGYDGAYVAAGSSNSVGEVSVGSSGGERKVTNVADGSGRYDAVNVGQLQGGVNYAIDESKKYTDQQINNINNGTSGMFQVNNSQNLSQPSASGSNSVAGGAGATSSGSDSTAVGNGAQATGSNTVALGAGSVATRDNTVSVGSAGAERQITNVANGTQATDAVNVRQLEASQQGTIRYDTNPSNGATNFNSVTLGNPAAGAGPTTVRNVAAGTAGTDAVNVNQLNAGMQQTLDWSKSYTDQRMDGFDRELRRTDNRASAGIASAMAMAALPQPSEAGRSMAAIGAGSFNGESGMAVGISGISEGGRWIYKFSGTTNTRGEGGVAVGAGIQW